MDRIYETGIKRGNINICNICKPEASRNIVQILIISLA